MKTTLHIGSNEIKLVAGNKSAIKVWMSQHLDDGLVQDDRIVEPLQVGATITDMFNSQGLQRSHVAVAVSGLPYTYRILELPPLKEDEVEEAILRSLQNEMAISIDDLYVSWAPLTRRPEAVDYFIVGADRELVDSVIETMKAADIKDWTMDLEPLALARTASAAEAIVACLDNDQIDIVLTANGHIREMHSTVIDYSGDDVEGYIEQFSNELMKVISFFQNNLEEDIDLAGFPIIVTGELISHYYSETSFTNEEESIIDQISRLTGHATSVIKFPVEFPVAFSPHAFSTNAGLFINDTKTNRRRKEESQKYHDVNIDILSGRYKSAPTHVPAWMAAVPVSLFVIIMAGLTVNSAVSESSTETETLQNQVTELQRQIIESKREAATQSKLEQELKSAEDALQAARLDYEMLLGDKGEYVENIDRVRSSLPEGTWLEMVDVQGQALRLYGKSISQYDIVKYVQSLEWVGYKVELNEVGIEDQQAFTFRITAWYEDTETAP